MKLARFGILIFYWTFHLSGKVLAEEYPDIFVNDGTDLESNPGNVALYGGFVSTNSTYGGDGLSISQKAMRGNTQGVKGRFGTADQGYFIRLQDTETRYRDLGVVFDPDEAKFRRTKLILASENECIVPYFDVLSRCRVGIFGSKRTMTETVPFRLYTSGYLVGIHTGIVTRYRLSDSWSIEPGISLDLPFIQREMGASSGDYHFGFNVDSQNAVLYEINKGVDVGGNFIVQHERLIYDGVASSGSKNSTLSHLDLGAAIILRARL